MAQTLPPWHTPGEPVARRAPCPTCGRDQLADIAAFGEHRCPAPCAEECGAGTMRIPLRRRPTGP